MTSRIPPSRRDPEYAPMRAAKALAQQVPGAGRIASAAPPAVTGALHAALRGRPGASPTSGGSAVVSATAPTSPATGALWWDTGAATPFTDTFNRANSTTGLGSPWSNSVGGSGTWGIDTNKAYCVTAADGNYVYVPVGDSDMEVSCRFSGLGGGGYPGLIFRMTDANNMYWVEVNPTGGMVLKRRDGVTTQNVTVPAASIVNGDLVTARIEGSVIDVSVNGSTIWTVTDTSVPSGTRAGLRCGVFGGSTTARYDDFSAVRVGGSLKLWDGTAWQFV